MKTARLTLAALALLAATACANPVAHEADGRSPGSGVGASENQMGSGAGFTSGGGEEEDEGLIGGGDGRQNGSGS